MNFRALYAPANLRDKRAFWTNQPPLLPLSWLVGDLNIVLEASDTSHRSMADHNFRMYDYVKKYLNSHELIDTHKELHGTDAEHTHYRLNSSSRIDYIFAPPVEDIYPKGFSTWVEVGEQSDKLEGASRPGHFRGVATALTILFNLIHPKFAFVGQKDAQQTVITKKLVRELHLPVEIVVMPTVREADGVALSSRNQDLSPDQRRAAPVLFRSLHVAEQMFAEGERSAARLNRAIRKELAAEPLARFDYLAITDTERLEPLDDLNDQRVLISLAAWFGETRLADNVILNDEKFKSKTGRLKLG